MCAVDPVMCCKTCLILRVHVCRCVKVWVFSASNAAPLCLDVCSLCVCIHEGAFWCTAASRCFFFLLAYQARGAMHMSLQLARMWRLVAVWCPVEAAGDFSEAGFTFGTVLMRRSRCSFLFFLAFGSVNHRERRGPHSSQKNISAHWHSSLMSHLCGRWWWNNVPPVFMYLS